MLKVVDQSGNWVDELFVELTGGGRAPAWKGREILECVDR